LVGVPGSYSCAPVYTRCCESLANGDQGRMIAIVVGWNDG
jgi:hypothetical protein